MNWEIKEQADHRVLVTLDDLEVDVRRDGCVHIYKHYELPALDSDYVHICDLQEFIDRLEALKARAIETFGEHWGK